MNLSDDLLALKQRLQNLNHAQQRSLAARFAAQVAHLSTDPRIGKILAIVHNPTLGPEALENARRMARAAIADAHCQCDSECNWKEQAAYFVARATAASVFSQTHCVADNMAWQAAVNARMAMTCAALDSHRLTPQETLGAQLQIANDFLEHEATS